MKQQIKLNQTGKIPADWEVLAIDDVADVVGGGTPSTKDTNNFGGDIPWITPKDLSNYSFRYIQKGERNITKKGLENSSAKLLPKGAVLLTTRAPVGYVAIAANEVTTNQGFRSLIPKNNFSSEFIYYLLKLNTEYLKSHASGTTFGELSGSTLKSLNFLFPPLKEQHAIASILRSLDDKIALNRQMNATLEKIGQALFKHWFVDFEFLNEKGKPYRSSGGEMVDSELGEIPKGWGVSSILDYADLLSGGTPKTEIAEYWGGKIKWVSAKDVTDAHGSFVLDTERKITQAGIDNSNAKLLPMNTTIVTARGTVGSYCILSQEMAINQTNYGLKAKSGFGDFFIFFSISNLVNQMKQNAYGTIFDTITTKTFKEMKIVIPSRSMIKSFDEKVNSIMNKILYNLEESRTLAAINNALLPKLMSGEIRVNI